MAPRPTKAAGGGGDAAAADDAEDDADAATLEAQIGGSWSWTPKGPRPELAIGAHAALHLALGALLLGHGALQRASMAHALAYAYASIGACLLYARVVRSNPGYVERDDVLRQLEALADRALLSAERGAAAPGAAAPPRAAPGPHAEEEEGSALLVSSDGDDASAPEHAAASLYLAGECARCDHQPRPLRARHCAYCRRCVWRYDHHCFLVANCVGEGNHALFLALLLAQTLACALTLPLVHGTMAANAEPEPPFEKWVILNGPLYLYLLLLWPAVVLLALLAASHAAMSLVNTTTYELTRRDALDYLRELPECAFPFAHANPCVTLQEFWLGARRRARGAGGTLVRRPPPMRLWPPTIWRNGYWTCC